MIKRNTKRMTKNGNISMNSRIIARAESASDGGCVHDFSKQRVAEMLTSSIFLFRRRRIRTFATITMTTVLWLQIIFLQLPPVVVGAVGGEGSGRIKPPPPPPPPRHMSQKLVDATISLETKTLLRNENREAQDAIPKVPEHVTMARLNKDSNIVPPPPPPRVVPEQASVGRASQKAEQDASPKQAISKNLFVGNDFKPPPPPPRRSSTERKEEVQYHGQAPEDAASTSVSISQEIEQKEILRYGEKEKDEAKKDGYLLATTGSVRAPRQRGPASLATHMDVGQAQHTKERHAGHVQRQSEPSPDRWQQEDQNKYQCKSQNTKSNYYQNASSYQPQPRGHLEERHQQHRQPQRPSQPSPSGVPSSAVTSAFKGLWGKVEQRLDDLANLEDTVSGRAQRLVNTAITTASTASRISPSRIRLLAESGAAAAARATPASMGNIARKKNASPSVLGATSVPLKSYGQKFQVAIQEKERQRNDQINQASHLANDKSKSISAKGGATSSPYHPPQHPSPPTSSSSPPGNPNTDSAASSPEKKDSANQNVNVNGNQGRNSYDLSRSSWEARPPISQTDRGNVAPPSETTASTPSGGKGTFVPPNANSNANNGSSQGNRDGRYNSGNYGSSGPGMNSRQFSNPSRSNEQQQSSHSRNSRIPWDTSEKSLSPPARSVQSLPNRSGLVHRFDDYDTPSWKRALEKLVPPIPSLPNIGKMIPRFRRGNIRYSSANLDAWDAAYGEDSNSRGGIFGFFKKSKAGSGSLPSSSTPFRQDRRDKNDDQPPLIASMLSRCDNGKKTSLLCEADVRAGNAIGRYKAALDILFILSSILGCKLLPGLGDITSLPTSFQEATEAVLTIGRSILSELSMGSWALFAFLYAYLFKYAQEVFLDQKTESLASSVASSVKEESEYAQLYLRLTAATPMNRNLPDRLAAISKNQVVSVVSKARLNSFVWIVLTSLTVMTVSAVGPILLAFSSAFTKIAVMKEWRQWPIEWQSLFGSSLILMQDLFHTLESHGTRAFSAFVEKPMQFSFHLCMFGCLIISTLLPRLEERRALASKRDEDEDLEEDDALSSSFESAEEWSRLGTSSASRLSMLSENGSVENALARWRGSHLSNIEESASRGPLLSLVRFVAYTLLAVLVTGLPVAVSYFLADDTSSSSNIMSFFRWDSLFDLSFIQLFLFGLVYRALQKVMESVTDASMVKNFQEDLVSIKNEIEESNRGNTDFQVMGSVSPSAGIAVRDLWAAHVTKRAWAVRGANLQCKNGEIVAILGEDGNGKTRLLTSLAESLTFPPKRTVTTNKVRGFISIGGLEISKWNRKMLKRRLGILLSDVRVVADSASLFSGWTMEEILEPIDGVRLYNNDSLQRTYTSAEKSAMLLALKLTGLYGTLLSRLPSKSSTIFTANEEDLRPTTLKPRSTLLSPGEWSKLILARVLSQTIYDNDNALSSNDKIENSMLGSILLLDEPTTMHSEVDEGQLFRDLRLTGAATVITTNKWATGRFADHICVMKNGSIVEMGNHNELLARGPQQSLYAAKWHAMTMQ